MRIHREHHLKKKGPEVRSCHKHGEDTGYQLVTHSLSTTRGHKHMQCHQRVHMPTRCAQQLVEAHVAYYDNVPPALGAKGASLMQFTLNGNMATRSSMSGTRRWAGTQHADITLLGQLLANKYLGSVATETASCSPFAKRQPQHARMSRRCPWVHWPGARAPGCGTAARCTASGARPPGARWRRRSRPLGTASRPGAPRPPDPRHKFGQFSLLCARGQRPLLANDTTCSQSSHEDKYDMESGSKV